jgi:diguanylate cyclase (GGDEF)-like protein
MSTQNAREALLEDLLHVSRTLSSSLNVKELYRECAQLLENRLGVRRIGFFEYQPEPGVLKLVSGPGPSNQKVKFNRTEGPLWNAIGNAEPFRVIDETGKVIFSEIRDHDQLSRFNFVMWIPLVFKETLLGLLTLGAKPQNSPFEDPDLFFLQHVSAQLSICLNNCRLYTQRRNEAEESDKTIQNLSLLYNIGKAMNYISDLKSLLQYILRQAVDITSAEKGSIMLYDPNTDRLKIRVLAGLEDLAYQEKVNNKEIECRSFQPGEGIAGRVFLAARPIIVNNVTEDTDFIEPKSSYARSIACIPMVVYSDVIGVINVTNKRDGEDFSGEDLQMLKAVADQAAVAINKAQLWNMAVTDSLTGLYVRRYFMAKLQEEIRRAERYNKVLSIVIADLDRFKRINDTYGHDVGDHVLETVGSFLKKNIRDVDVVARYGGEEFLLMIPEADKDSAFCLSERLREKFSQINLEDLPPITISLGIATYPSDGTEIDELIRKADAAMYTAKQNGRNRVVKYSSDVKFVRPMTPVIEP